MKTVPFKWLKPFPELNQKLLLMILQAKVSLPGHAAAGPKNRFEISSAAR